MRLDQVLPPHQLKISLKMPMLSRLVRRLDAVALMAPAQAPCPWRRRRGRTATSGDIGIALALAAVEGSGAFLSSAAAAASAPSAPNPASAGFRADSSTAFCPELPPTTTSSGSGAICTHKMTMPPNRHICFSRAPADRLKRPLIQDRTRHSHVVRDAAGAERDGKKSFVARAGLCACRVRRGR